MQYLTGIFSLFLVINVFNPGLTRDTSSFSVNSLISFNKDVSVSVKDQEFDKLAPSFFLNNVFSPVDIEPLKTCLLLIFVCGDKLFQMDLLTNSFFFFLSGVECVGFGNFSSAICFSYLLAWHLNAFLLMLFPLSIWFDLAFSSSYFTFNLAWWHCFLKHSFFIFFFFLLYQFCIILSFIPLNDVSSHLPCSLLCLI